MTKRRRIGLGCGGAALCVGLGLVGFAWSVGIVGGPDFSSVASIEAEPTYADAALLSRARELPSVRAYIEHGFAHQPNGSFCGPTSAADLAASVDRAVTPEATLSGSGITTVFGILPGGITLEEVAGLVTHAVPSADVDVVRPESPTELRATIMRTADASVRVLVNFHRGPLFGRGGGHHSPVGGYLEPEDLAVILDTNADYHGPWLVDVDRLFLGVHEVDAATGRSRGLVVATMPGDGT